MSDLADRLADRQIERQSRTEQALEEAGEGRTTRKVSPKTAPPPRRHQEKIGVGRDLVDETTRVVLKGIDGRIKRLADSGTNPSLLAELRARRKLILEQAEQAKK